MNSAMQAPTARFAGNEVPERQGSAVPREVRKVAADGVDSEAELRRNPETVSALPVAPAPLVAPDAVALPATRLAGFAILPAANHEVVQAMRNDNTSIHSYSADAETSVDVLNDSIDELVADALAATASDAAAVEAALDAVCNGWLSKGEMGKVGTATLAPPSALAAAVETAAVQGVPCFVAENASMLDDFESEEEQASALSAPTAATSACGGAWQRRQSRRLGTDLTSGVPEPLRVVGVCPEEPLTSEVGSRKRPSEEYGLFS